MSEQRPDRPSLAPRNWPGWILVGLIWLLGQMPHKLGVLLSAPLGRLLERLMNKRRRVALRNIEACFPDLDPDRREELVRRHFRALARLLFETAWVWAAPARRLDRWGSAENAEYARQALDSGRGVLILTAHSTCLEISGWFAARALPRAPRVVYRPLNNEVVEWYSLVRRQRFVEGLIKKRVFRSMVQYLQEGGVLWYAPDQDFGPNRSEFAPFFGIPTATLAALVGLAEKSGCVVLPMFTAYDDARGKYVARFLPVMENFPSGDRVADLARYNEMVEAHVREWPHQYWWIHRRFKTRPEGDPPFYD